MISAYPCATATISEILQFKEPPLALGIPGQRTPLLPSEFQKALHHGVWIFSGIAQT